MSPTTTVANEPAEPSTPTIDPDTLPDKPGAPTRVPNPAQPTPDPLTPLKPDRECDPDEGACPYKSGAPDLTGMVISAPAIPE